MMWCSLIRDAFNILKNSQWCFSTENGPWSLQSEGSACTQWQAALNSHVQIIVSFQVKCLRDLVCIHFCCRSWCSAVFSLCRCCNVHLRCRDMAKWGQVAWKWGPPLLAVLLLLTAQMGGKKSILSFPSLVCLILTRKVVGAHPRQQPRSPPPPSQAEAQSRLLPG